MRNQNADKERIARAMEAIVPFGQAAYVQQLRPFQRALIYLVMLCFDWPENQVGAVYNLRIKRKD